MYAFFTECHDSKEYLYRKNQMTKNTLKKRMILAISGAF